MYLWNYYWNQNDEHVYHSLPKVSACPFVILSTVVTSHRSPGNHWPVFCHYRLVALLIEFLNINLFLKENHLNHYILSLFLTYFYIHVSNILVRIFASMFINAIGLQVFFLLMALSLWYQGYAGECFLFSFLFSGRICIR